MEIIKAFIESLDKNKKWILIGATLYLLPVFYRFVTKNSIVPLLDNTLFLYYRNSQIIPVNLETLGLTFIIFPAVGAMVGASFLENLFERRFTGLEKYLARVFGSLSFGFLWILTQFIGFNFFGGIGSWGSSIWSSPDVYARNLLVALIIAPLVPYVVEFIYKIRMKK